MSIEKYLLPSTNTSYSLLKSFPTTPFPFAPSKITDSTTYGFLFSVMTLAKMIERLLVVGNPSDGLLRDCFNSLIETSVQLKGLDEEMEDEQNDGESEDDDNDDDDDDDEEIQDDDEVQLLKYVDLVWFVQ